MTEELTEAEWVDDTAKEKIHGFDERAVLRGYRFCKQHYEFFLGVGITILVFLLILK